ncbi:class I SAM-dependent methyltransferase [Methanobacterium sp.]|uniref:class I SAM-dependent methyltransferase n=1 Tax=Methanobacterium sp. TaxID=2164 RepID=UPI003C78E7DC
MKNTRDQEKYWDKAAEKKEFPTPFKIEEFEKYVSKEMGILDVGCGYGRTLDELHNRGFENLTGIDYSQGMINRGLKEHPYLNLIKNDGDKIPFSDNEFDAVLLIAVLTSNTKNGEQENIISEILRVLKDGGILYLTDFLINQDKRNLKRYQEYEDKYGIYGTFELPEGAVLRHHTEEHILELTKDFTEIVFEKAVFDTMNGHKSNGFYYIGKKK